MALLLKHNMGMIGNRLREKIHQFKQSSLASPSILNNEILNRKCLYNQVRFDSQEQNLNVRLPSLINNTSHTDSEVCRMHTLATSSFLTT